jgi:hypothetical protein
MSQSLSVLVQSVEVAEPVEAGGLQVFALRWRGGGLEYATLDEALAGGQLEVTEVGEAGTVPTLKVANKGDRMTFLMAGEQLCGGKQNRVLNASIMVAAHSELPIPVSCVERGRWGYRSRHFGSSGSSSHGALRKLMHGHATRSYRACGSPTSDQGEVWREVDRKLTETGSHSDTRMLHQMYDDLGATLQDVAAQLPVPAGASGAVFALGGKVVGFDLFDSPATLAKLWPKLVRAYAVDARYVPAEGAPPVRREAVAEWIKAMPQAKEEKFKSPGLGDDVRLEGPTLVGAGLLVDEQPVHVEVFANDAGPAA